MSRGLSYHLPNGKKSKKKTLDSNHPKKLHPYGQGAIQHDPFGMCIRDLSQITHHLEPAWELGNHRQGVGGKQKAGKCSEKKDVYHLFRQLWLVLGVKLMEINSNLFSR